MTRGDLNHRQSVYAAASHNGRVKMGDWNFLGGILEEVHIHSTVVGKIWLTILFIFRMLVLGVAAEDVWNDEQVDFICNTDQPGCRNVCYDLAFPISLIRYWVLQVIFVSSPSLVYMGHALYHLRGLEKERRRKKLAVRRELDALDEEQAEARKRLEREMRQLEQGKVNKAPLRGSLLRTYVAHIVTRSAVEVAFMTGQYVLYGFQLRPLFRCERDPCPNAVDCYVSRPTEKSVFMVFMQSIAGISLFLNFLEIIHLGYKTIKKGFLDYYPHLQDELDDYYTCKKDSAVPQTCTSTSCKTTIASAPSGYNLLLQKALDEDVYPSTYLNLQGELAGKSLDDPKNAALHSPTEHNSNSTATSSDAHLPSCHSVSPPKPADDFAHIPPHRGEEKDGGGPDSPKRQRDSTPASSCPTLLVREVRKPWRVNASLDCSTVLESKSSDTDSPGGTKPCGGYSGSRSQASSKSDLKRSSRPSTPDSLEDSGSGSRQDRPSMASSCPGSRRAPTDLQI